MITCSPCYYQYIPYSYSKIQYYPGVVAAPDIKTSGDPKVSRLKEPVLRHSGVFVNSRAHAHGCVSRLLHASALTLLLSNMAVLWKQEKC